MTDTISYIIDVLATLCGFDAPAQFSVYGLCVVGISAVVLVYACFRAALLTVWPGEPDTMHIKHHILHDEGPDHAN